MTRPDRLTIATAARLVADIAADPERVIYSAHAQQRMRERRITPAEVIGCLTKGIITEGPFVNIRNAWQVRISRQTTQKFHVVVAMERQQRLIVITTIVE